MGDKQDQCIEICRLEAGQLIYPGQMKALLAQFLQNGWRSPSPEHLAHILAEFAP